jgi:hypothetical protein
MIVWDVLFGLEGQMAKTMSSVGAWPGTQEKEELCKRCEG